MKEELSEIKKGTTWERIYECLWVIATVRYVTYEQLKKYYPEEIWRKHVATKKKLNILVEKEFLRQSSDGVLMATRKAVSLLKEYSDKNYKIIKLPKGNGQRDSLYNTDVLLQILQLPDFHALFYPVFHESKKDDQPFLIPDGAVIFKKDHMARLVFLEIEKPKPDWLGYVEKKQWKYRVVAERQDTWAKWWQVQCERLGLNFCKIEEFGFIIWCIGEFDADWDGWEFKKKINH